MKPAKYLPPWALDPGWVLSHLTLNTFIANIDLSAVAEPSATCSPTVRPSRSRRATTPDTVSR